MQKKNTKRTKTKKRIKEATKKTYDSPFYGGWMSQGQWKPNDPEQSKKTTSQLSCWRFE